MSSANDIDRDAQRALLDELRSLQALLTVADDDAVAEPPLLNDVVIDGVAPVTDPPAAPAPAVNEAGDQESDWEHYVDTVFTGVTTVSAAAPRASTVTAGAGPGGLPNDAMPVTETPADDAATAAGVAPSARDPRAMDDLLQLMTERLDTRLATLRTRMLEAIRKEIRRAVHKR